MEDSGKLVEVQIRTLLQHLWAELSEKVSDVVDKEIKYGGGDKEITAPLETLSDSIQTLETKEREFQSLMQQARTLASVDREDLPSDLIQQLDEQVQKVQVAISREKQGMVEIFNETTQNIVRLKGG